MLNLLKLPCFETHLPGMSIFFLIVISIIYGLLGNIASIEVIIFTFCVYVFFLIMIIYVDRLLSSDPYLTSNDPNWYLYTGPKDSKRFKSDIK
jgi:hypothetical protein